MCDRKHVLEHLEPYVCLFSDCARSKRMYGTREAWKEHMRMAHGKTWCCCFGCNRSFRLTEDFDTHLLKHHAAYFHASELPTLRELCEKHVLLPIDGSRCSLCRAEVAHPRRLRRHIAEHMEFIALDCLGIHTRDFMSSTETGDEVDSETRLSIRPQSMDRDPEDQTASVVVTGPGLLEIFNACVDSISSIEHGLDYHWEHQDDKLRVSLLQLRLSRWKASVHLDGDSLNVAHDAKYASPGEVQRVERLLIAIREALSSAEERSERHQVKDQTSRRDLGADSGALQILTARVRQCNFSRQKGSSLVGWVLRDSVKMTNVIDDLDRHIQGLVGMFPEIETNQAYLASTDATAILLLDSDKNTAMQSELEDTLLDIASVFDLTLANAMATFKTFKSKQKSRVVPSHLRTSTYPDSKGPMGEKSIAGDESTADDEGKGRGKADTQYGPSKKDKEVDDDGMDNRGSTRRKGRGDAPAEPPPYESLWPSWDT